MLIGVDIVEQRYPGSRSNDEVEETLHHIELADNRGVLLQPLTDILCGVFRFFTGSFEEREHDECKVSFKTFLRVL